MLLGVEGSVARDIRAECRDLAVNDGVNLLVAPAFEVVGVGVAEWLANSQIFLFQQVFVDDLAKDLALSFPCLVVHASLPPWSVIRLLIRIIGAKCLTNR